MALASGALSVAGGALVLDVVISVHLCKRASPFVGAREEHRDKGVKFLVKHKRLKSAARAHRTGGTQVHTGLPIFTAAHEEGSLFWTLPAAAASG